MSSELRSLASDLVALDSRDFVSNVAIAERVGGIAFSGHMDTVPDTGWRVGWGGGRKGRKEALLF